MKSRPDFDLSLPQFEPSEAVDWIAMQSWTFAKTMPRWPHWYVVRGRCVQDSRFEDFVRLIRREGKARAWGNRTFIYLRIGDWEYWTMGAPVADTTIINRARPPDWSEA